MVEQVIFDVDSGAGTVNSNVSSVWVSATPVNTDPYDGSATITVQGLSIEYYREPNCYYDTRENSNTLSSVDVSGNVAGTNIRASVKAYSRQYFTSGTFSGSAVFVPQTFETQVFDKDIHNNQYDGVSGVSGVMGPAGRVITKVEGVFRRPYTNGDVTWDESISNGFNWQVCTTPQTEWASWEQGLDSFAGAGHMDRVGSWPYPSMWIAGPYDPSKEDIRAVQTFITDVSHTIKNNGFWVGDYSTGGWVKMPNYNPQFHKFV